MTNGIDLHVHTNASDGLHAPSQVVHMALEAGLSAIAISDHDTVEGIAPALEAASGTQLEVIPAVEISTESYVNSEVHILGYFIDWTSQEFICELEPLRASRLMRAKAMHEQLDKLGMSVPWERLQALAGDGALGRPHLARALQEAGFVSSPQQAFDLYLGRGKPAYVPRYKVTATQAVRLIRQAGGISVLAHPWMVTWLLPSLVAEGLGGLEVYYTGYSPEMTTHLQKLAGQYDLACTGGSDFHGLAFLPDNRLGGVGTPVQCLEELRSRVPAR